MSELYEKISSAKSLDPDEISEMLFSDVPKKELTYGVLLPENSHVNDSSLTFEILLSILLEGMAILHDDFENCDLNLMTVDSIKCVSPYMRSLCFDIKVNEHDNTNEFTKEKLLDDYYCKIILRCDKQYTMYFDMKDIQKDYTFFFNPKYGKNYPQDKHIKDVYTVLIVGNKTFKISFDYIDMASVIEPPINATKQYSY
jgi:hypothetical protein